MRPSGVAAWQFGLRHPTAQFHGSSLKLARGYTLPDLGSLASWLATKAHLANAFVRSSICTLA